jgi:hypothetical protein
MERHSEQHNTSQIAALPVPCFRSIDQTSIDLRRSIVVPDNCKQRQQLTDCQTQISADRHKQRISPCEAKEGEEQERTALHNGGQVMQTNSRFCG